MVSEGIEERAFVRSMDEIVRELRRLGDVFYDGPPVARTDRSDETESLNGLGDRLDGIADSLESIDKNLALWVDRELDG